MILLCLFYFYVAHIKRLSLSGCWCGCVVDAEQEEEVAGTVEKVRERKEEKLKEN